MPTPLDRAMQSRNAFFGTPLRGESHLIRIDTIVAFAGIVTAVSAWSIWGGEMFPGEKDPTGGKHARYNRWIAVN